MPFARKAPPISDNRALMYATATFIAFSPYIGLQSALALLCSWLFGLPKLPTIAIVNLINNPWTMLPIAAFEYKVGEWLTHNVLTVQVNITQPAIHSLIKTHIDPYLSRWVTVSDISLWSFIVGAHAVGLAAALIVYFVARCYYKKRPSTQESYENHCSE